MHAFFFITVYAHMWSGGNRLLHLDPLCWQLQIYWYSNAIFDLLRLCTNYIINYC